MTDVILHGALGRRFGKHHRFFVKKPIDAVRALMANKKGFHKISRQWGREGKFYEIICDGKLIETEGEAMLDGGYRSIHIVPIIIGTGNALKIGLGIFFVVIGVVFGQGWLVMAGISLIVGGVMGYLFPPTMASPSFSSSPNTKSFLFSSLQNSTSRGAPVQIGYGRLKVGSQVISTALEPSRVIQGGSTAFQVGNGAGGGGEDSWNSRIINAGGYDGGGTYYLNNFLYNWKAPIAMDEGKIG